MLYFIILIEIMLTDSTLQFLITLEIYNCLIFVTFVCILEIQVRILRGYHFPSFNTIYDLHL